MAIGAWLLHLTLMNTGFFSTYGVDLFVHIALFYGAWMPVGACLSLDRRAGRTSAAPSPLARLSLRILQLHLCIVYLTAGLSKARGLQWRNEEAIWQSVMQPQFAQFDLSWFAEVAWIPTLLGWLVVVIEIGYPIFIWGRPTGRPWLGATVAMHLGIGLVLGLWFFAAVMILLNLSAFGYALLGRLPEAATRHPPSAPAEGLPQANA